MNCVRLEVIEHYISGQLKTTELTEFEAHLKACRVCRAKVAEASTNEKLLTELRTCTFQKESPQPSKYRTAAVETTDRAQSLLGDRYRVIRKVGEGSAGQVFQAIDTVLERLVAIKFLQQKSPAKGADAETWHEARLMSQLNHPNIAQIYEIGELDVQRFIIMEWVDGLPLTEAWKGLQLQQRLRIYLLVLDAVVAAHRRNIIHRDIKPSNILVTSGLKPKVLDFGIAIEIRPLEGIEQGLYRGTPAYSAPEQISPPVKIYPATDVFALGILLYELLTDTLPFPQTDPEELFQAIRSEYPELPSALQEKIPIPLQNICLKALEKEPQKRYPDAQSLSNEIHRYLRGEKVWSRPSFLTDKIHQEVFYHRQKLKVWRDNELLTEKEHDRLEHIYERVIAPPDPSIIEARKLSLSQVCLYLGGWITVLGSFVLFYKAWEQIPIYWQPTPAIVATMLMATLGIAMWRRKESRLAVGFLATANLLIPIALLLTLAQWEVLSFPDYRWGAESVAMILKMEDSYVIVGNVQLYISLWCWLAFSLIFLQTTRSSIFVLFSIIAFLTLLTTCYLITGMIDVYEGKIWDPEIIAGRYLYAGIGLFIFGVVLDRRKYTHYAWPLCVVGLMLIVVCLSVIALSESTLFGWLGYKPKFLDEVEHHLLSFACNGLIYLGLATVCRSMGTILQRRLAQALNWLGPLHILSTLRILDLDKLSMVVSESHQGFYRILLPIASFAFVFGSVARQMKSFFFSGLAGIATAVHRFTVEYWKEYFAWPVSLIITGIVWMFVSWLVPRWKARMALKNKR
jgi:serine/threonine protein kinase